jgi:deazaflavin-dependent oxidoreductase (nitroreductase family)
LPLEPTPEGTYGAKMPGGKWLMKLIEPLAKRQVAAYRKSGGTNRMATIMKFPVVLLTTRGARTGEQRTVSLGGFSDGDDAWLIVASKGGSATHPAWFKNMIRHPDDVSLEVGSRKMKVRCDSLTGHEREDAYSRIAKIAPQYAGYPKKTNREIPVVRLTRISD